MTGALSPVVMNPCYGELWVCGGQQLPRGGTRKSDQLLAEGAAVEEPAAAMQFGHYTFITP